jgi:hypothetical protein
MLDECLTTKEPSADYASLMPTVRISRKDGARVADATEGALMGRVQGPLRRDESGALLIPFVSSETPEQSTRTTERALNDTLPDWRDEHQLSVSD